jgi:acyl-CoA thioester hydrolase
VSRSPAVDPQEILADPRVVWTEDVLRFRDTDANGHVNNSVFSVFCESGRVNMLHHVLAEGRAEGTYFVVVRLAIDFRAELYYPGRVRCGTWLPSVGRTSLGFAQALVGADGRLAATAEAVVVQMDAASRRPAPIDGRLREIVTPLLRP